MAQKASQISLSVVQKDILSEALNLVYHGMKSQSKKLIRLGDNLIEHLLIDARITEAYQEFAQSFVPDEDFSIQEALDQLDFIEGRFYSTTGTAGAEVMFVRRHRAQKADELINRKAGANLLENRYGTGLLWSFRLFWHLFPPATVSREYVPNSEPIVQDDYAQYANTWVPPTIKPVLPNEVPVLRSRSVMVVVVVALVEITSSSTLDFVLIPMFNPNVP